jgi:acetolactate synthase-1/2/3 large subunit
MFKSSLKYKVSMQYLINQILAQKNMVIFENYCKTLDTSAMEKVSDTLIKTLKELGVKYIFGVPSGNWVDYMNAIEQVDGIEFILVSNESSAGFMADVCWRLTGTVAACFGTFGPGACNLSTGVCGGYLDRSPMIALTDEMGDDMLNRVTQMNIDHQTLFKPITKYTTRLSAKSIRETIHKAYSIAVSEVPGPVHIGLPQGLGREISDEENFSPYKSKEIPCPDKDSIDKMLNLFSESKKPIVALGITAVRAGIRDEISKLIEKFKIPVVLTPMAKGMVPDDHPCYAGVLAHALANMVGETHQQADLVIGIGYDSVEINYEDWMPGAPLLHIDTRPADVDPLSITLGCNVIGDIKVSVDYLLAIDGEPKSWDMDALAQRRQQMFDMLKAPKGSFGPRMVLDGLREILPQDGIMTCDVGAHLHLIGQKWRTPSPDCQLMTNGCSSMGFAIPAAIAAKLSCPDREVCCVVGDGGFNMSAGELATAQRLNLKIVFVVIHDASLSLIRIKQDRKGYKHHGTELTSSSETCPTSNYFGVPVLQAVDLIQYQNALSKAFSANGPMIIEAYVSAEEYDELLLTGNK